MVTSLEHYGTALSSDESIPKVNHAINEVPMCFATAMSRTTPKQALKQNDSNWS